MRSSEIEKVDVVMYRRSEHPNYETAFKNGGVHCLTETYGYGPSMDSIYNCNQVAVMLNQDDIRVRMIVDGVTLSECFLSEAQNLMHKELCIE
jgi:hypothetical protein